MKERKFSVYYESLLRSLRVSLTAVCQTGVSSSNPRQSHRVHPVHEAEKSHAPAGHRRPEEAECTAGAARYSTSSHCLHACFTRIPQGRGVNTDNVLSLCQTPFNFLACEEIQMLRRHDWFGWMLQCDGPCEWMKEACFI